MTLPDHLIVTYLTIYTEVPREKIAEVEAELASDPMGGKLLLAREIVARYHGEETAQREQEWFLRTFSARQTPLDLPVVIVEEGPRSALLLCDPVSMRASVIASCAASSGKGRSP